MIVASSPKKRSNIAYEFYKGLDKKADTDTEKNNEDASIEKLTDLIRNNKISNLVNLDLSNNSLEEIPEGLGELINLKHLNLSKNSLHQLPNTCSNLYKLKHLDLSGNKFTYIPMCLQVGMEFLQVLKVSSNERMSLETPIASIHLEYFEAKNNKTCYLFPSWILTKHCSNLRELILDGTQFKRFQFSQEISEFSQLSILSMCDCSISLAILLKILERAKCLDKLLIGNRNNLNPNGSGNSFSEIPLELLSSQVKLTELEMRSSNLSIILSLGDITNLTKLDIGCNSVSWLPDDICLLDKLQELIVDEMNLDFFPENIGKMACLRVIKASNNYLTELPATMGNLTRLEHLDIYENKFEEIPSVVVKLFENLKKLDLEMNNFSTQTLPVSLDSLQEILYNIAQLFTHLIIIQVDCARYKTLLDALRSDDNNSNRQNGLRPLNETRSPSGPLDESDRCSTISSISVSSR